MFLTTAAAAEAAAMTTNAHDRQPPESRNSGWPWAVARFLTGRGITPKQISIASMVAAGLAGLAFLMAGQITPNWRPLFLSLAALFCQLRLLCNLFDGMVATEGRNCAPDGAFWNEFPDRVADILIFAGIGHGIGAPALGWAAAGVAILTAYVRALGRNCGLPADFSGPMTKQHRMALTSSATLLSLWEPIWGGYNQLLSGALWVIAIGSATTVVRRAARIVVGLREVRNA